VVSAPAASDSREVVPGGLFVAVSGARTDGHDHAGPAIERGAAAILAARPVGHPAIVVPDVIMALGALARFVLQQLHPVVIGITGTVGKTTTKDLLAQILETSDETVATARSFNNELGLPLTVLRADQRTRYLVLEMGIGSKGDLTYLTGLAPPQLGVVLNVGSAHLSTVGGTLADVAAAKAELVHALPPAASGGVAILNADDSRVAAMARETSARLLWFGRSAQAAIGAEDACLDEAGRARFTLRTPDGTAAVRMRLPGEHQIGNALAAAAAATTLGLTAGQVARALSEATARAAGRLEVLDRPGGVTIVNDAYNANPESMKAGLRALMAMAAGRRTVAVLGEMTGQGEASADRHREIGRLTAELGVDFVVTVGQGAPVLMAAARAQAGPGAWVESAPDLPAALSLLRGALRTGDIVLLKASNPVGLTELATALTEADPAVADPA
jgi:UDP-N-acetylmuramoyl-tripeptide--D-alanyl-D-alanine ligase